MRRRRRRNSVMSHLAAGAIGYGAGAIGLHRIGDAGVSRAARALARENPHPLRSKAWRARKTKRVVWRDLFTRYGRYDIPFARFGRPKCRKKYGHRMSRNGHPSRSRPRRGQRIKHSQIIPFSAARRLVGAANYARAAAGFRAFHGLAPLHAVRVRIDDGSRKLTRRAVYEMGEAASLEYQPRGHSKKHADKSGRRITWTHKLGEKGGTKPVWVHDPKSGVTSLVGGTYRIGKQKGHGNLSWVLH